MLGPSTRVRLASLLVVVSTVGWRRGAYFSGAVDPVVAVKGLVSLIALALAISACSGLPRRRLGTGSLWFLALVLLASFMGAMSHGTTLAGSVVAVRVLIVASTVVFLLRAGAATDVLGSLVAACGIVGLVAAVTGIPSSDAGRLQGGVPQISPNELALLSSVVLLYIAWHAIEGRVGLLLGGVALVALGVLWATGSRTALIMVLLGIVVMLLNTRRLRPGLVVGALLLGAVGALVVAATGAVAGFLERDGSSTSTLDSRFIAWRAAFSWATSLWQVAFGGGLSVKIIPIEGQWWNTQPLDSSWVSLLVQTGYVGITAAALWVLWILRGAGRSPRPHRALLLGLFVFLVGRSTTESGLFDATPAFLLLFATSLLVEGASRDRLRAEAADEIGQHPTMSDVVPLPELVDADVVDG